MERVSAHYILYIVIGFIGLTLTLAVIQEFSRPPIEKIREQIDNHDYDGAWEQLEVFITDHPAHAEAHFLRLKIIALKNFDHFDEKLAKVEIDKLLEIGEPVIPFLYDATISPVRNIAFQFLVLRSLWGIDKYNDIPWYQHTLESASKYPRSNWIRREGYRLLGEVLQKDFLTRSKILLLNGLSENDSLFKVIAATSLGKLKNKRGLNILMNSINSKSFDIQLAALEGLGYIGGEKAVSVIKPFTKHHNQLMRITAARSLAILGQDIQDQDLYEVLRGDDIQKIKLACSTLRFMDSSIARKKLFEMLENKNIYVQLEAIEQLSRLNLVNSIEPIGKFLYSTHTRERRSAITGLRWMSRTLMDQRIWDYLIIALADSDKYVKTEAEGALTQLGKIAVPQLIKTAENTKGQSKLTAIKLISKTSDPRAMEILLMALLDKELSKYAVKGLVVMEGTVIDQVLITLLDQSNIVLKRYAVAILGSRNVISAIPYLKRLLKDDADDIVRFNCHQALFQLTGIEY